MAPRFCCCCCTPREKDIYRPDDSSDTKGVFATIFHYIEEDGKETPGLYGPCGETDLVRYFITTLKKNPIDADIDTRIISPMIASASVKLLYRNQNPPLIPTSRLNEVIRIASIPDVGAPSRQLITTEWKEFLFRLSPESFHALKLLFTHLTKMATYSKQTGMDSTALAAAWGPYIFPFQDTSNDAKMRAVQNLVQDMIDNCQTFFPFTPFVTIVRTGYSQMKPQIIHQEEFNHT